jgi:hypothetical protein
MTIFTRHGRERLCGCAAKNGGRGTATLAKSARQQRGAAGQRAHLHATRQRLHALHGSTKGSAARGPTDGAPRWWPRVRRTPSAAAAAVAAARVRGVIGW